MVLSQKEKEAAKIGLSVFTVSYFSLTNEDAEVKNVSEIKRDFKG